MSEEVTLTDEHMEALSSVTLPVHGWGVRKAMVRDTEFIALTLAMQDESGELFYIRPFLAVEDALSLADQIIETTKES